MKMGLLYPAILLNIIVCIAAGKSAYAGSTILTDTIRAKHTWDFNMTGDGNEANWNTAHWTELAKRKGTADYRTRIKILYSDSGIYCLYYCADTTLTASLNDDFLNLWTEDVVEAFFWPSESEVMYFEYELSPLNYELPILVPNNHGKFLGWRPWHYEGNRKTKHFVVVEKNNGKVVSWTAEFFIPFSLLAPLNNVPPARGTHWRANFYRIDYDQGESSWEWQKVGKNFHDYESFGILFFE